MKPSVFPLPLRFLALLLLLSVILAFFCLQSGVFKEHSRPTEGNITERITTVILDAGHGGEDGGALSATGVVEKDVNLKIVFLLRDLLEANGIHVILTRESDVLLYDRNVNYQGRKKMLDLLARKKVADENPDAVFVSIHMNTYPLQSCRGLQVWYSPNDARSLSLATSIQETAREQLDPQNDRSVKRAGSNIYLMDRISTPAVLVECGFLTNPEEADLLATSQYQQKIALAVFLSIVNTEFEAEKA